MPEKWVLRQYQSLPLQAKVSMSLNRIREWYDHFGGNVYISFSGGKDSTVLAHLVHTMYPDVPMVFSNTGLEYPEIQSFARESGATIIRPSMRFDEVISTYGYPVISKEVAEAIYIARRLQPGKWRDSKRIELMGKRMNGDKKSPFNKEKWLPLCRDTDFRICHFCCHVMKKNPLKEYEKKTGRKPYIGNLAQESKLREQAWIMHGCNAFDIQRQVSQPMSFWLEQDVLDYIRTYQIDIASVYGDIVAVDQNGYEYPLVDGMDQRLQCSGYQRTGCIFCGFSIHLESKEKGETKFQKLAKTHPRQYEYCMMGGQYVNNPDYDPAAPVTDGDWVNWNPKKIWVPSKQGLGMKKVFDDCNKIYGKDFIRYE